MDQFEFSTADVVREIDDVLVQLNDLATSEVGSNDFYQQLLSQTTSVLGGSAAAVWWLGPRDAMHLAHQLRLAELFEDRAAYQREARRLHGQSTAESEPFRNSIRNGTALSVPLLSAGERRGVFVVYQRDPLEGAVIAGQLRFLSAVAEIAVAFEFHSRERRQSGNAAKSKALELYLMSIHREGTLHEVAHRVVNDGRVFLGSDRVSVLLRSGRVKHRLIACGGANAPERRSTLVRNMEKLVSAVCRSGETLVVPSDTNLLPPEVECPLEEYVDVSAVRSLVIVPLVPSESPNARPFGAMVIESFGLDDEGADHLNEISVITSHASLALKRTQAISTFPMNLVMGATKPIRWALDRQFLPMWLFGLAAITIILYCVTMIPIPFRVTVPGTLRPSNRTYVFANHDGFVKELNVRHGSKVRRGDVLLSLYSPDLELEIKRVLGELHTQRQQFESIEAERLQLIPTDRLAERKASELSSGALTASARIRSLDAQFQLLSSERERLRHTSPIGGTVLDWDVEDKLHQRRVREGQRVFEVAQLDGDWHLELAVPDHRVGHVLRALEDNENLEVSFVLENEATTTVHGVSHTIARTTQLVDGIPSVLMEVEFDKNAVSELHPNATAIAKIHCGRRSAAFVWLHEVYEEVRRRFF